MLSNDFLARFSHIVICKAQFSGLALIGQSTHIRNETMRIVINRAALKAVSRFAAKQDIRYYLQGVLVESSPTETRIVGCDGHTLAIHRSQHTGENEGQWTGIVPLPTVLALLKMKATHKTLRDAPIYLTVQESGEIRADWIDQSVNFRTIDGKFPEYQRVIPAKLDGTKAWYQPEYLQRIADASKDMGESFTFGFNGNSASLAYIGQSMLAVIMPMRLELTIGTERAEWARNAIPKVTATVSPDIAAMIDPSGALQNAGLVTVTA
jgi:DNA polymerase-3 subunit beta